MRQFEIDEIGQAPQSHERLRKSVIISLQRHEIMFTFVGQVPFFHIGLSRGDETSSEFRSEIQST